MKRFKRLYIYVFTVYALFVFGYGLKTAADSKKEDRVVFCNVGQGDAALVLTKEGRSILIDGGPDKKVLSCLGRELPWIKRRIDLLIVSHNHEDHIAGLVPVLERYQVKEVWLSGAVDKSDAYIDLLRALKLEQAKIEIIDSKKEASFGDLSVNVIYPIGSRFKQQPADQHDSTLVVRFSFANLDFLATGDLGPKEEAEILRSTEEVEAELLKVPHHGSETALLEEFLKKINPQVAIISVGENNRYGHPAEATLNLLQKRGTEILRTDVSKKDVVCRPLKENWKCE